MDGMLSQDEINALLNNMNSDDTAADTSAPLEDDLQMEEEFELLDSEKDAVGEISNISMGTAATTLSSLLNQKVNITTPKVSISNWNALASEYDRPCVLLQISYKEGISGNNVLILKEKDVKIITDLMMGGAGDINEEEALTELHLSAIGEAMNQMMGSAATSMSSMFNRKIDISPPIANLIEIYGEAAEDMPKFLTGSFVKVAFTMQISNLIDSEIMQLYPIEFAKELLGMFGGGTSTTAKSSEPVKPEPNAQQQQTPPQPVQPIPQMGYEQPVQPPMGYGQPMMQQQPMGYGQPMMQQPPMGYGQPMMQPMPMGYGQPMMQNDVNVQPASFQPFSGDLGIFSQKENINLIMDVPLEVTVELGRTTKSIKDILEFSPGTIVELNKIAGECVDVLVNGKYVAKGEVVVIEESFGVRITEIVK